ncbi:L,D-transpeptidase family protein [Pseudomonas sp. RL_15y_Pfl2_60]|uniref:L,D-transpeptidase family protein n=1 Tax=Pseudomonas sp. RL_15y_Pfl2_60 TaxID=3088709 RepID=UPI0030DD42DF
MRWLLVLICFSLAANASANTPVPPPLQKSHQAQRIDKVLILKSERKLQLISKGQPFKSYRVSLGKKPQGHKQFEGDQRTPEGIYWLDWRKTSDNYQLSMHISYPNARDQAFARSKGLSAGGMIMIHGTPIDEEYPEWYFSTLDWTNGCIAMKNTDMREIWSLVKDGTLIEIRP